MPDPTTPADLDAGGFFYEITENGNLLIGGESVGKVSDSTLGDIVPKVEEETKSDTSEKEEPKEDAQLKEETSEKEEPIKTPAEYELPSKVKIKLTVEGKEQEREFTPEELRKSIEKGIVANRRFQEAYAKEREIEPFLHIKDSPEFKEWLNQIAQERPDLAPKPPPAPSPEDVMGYRLRREEPESNEIVEAMKDWQATLPVYEAKALENNHRVFNMTYDRFKAARQSKQSAVVTEQSVTTAKVESSPIQNKEDAEKIIALKEKQKDAARTVPPSVAAGERDAVQVHKKQEAELRKRIRSGDRNAEFALAALLYAGDLDRQR